MFYLMPAVEFVGVNIWCAYLKALEMRMWKLVLDLPVAQILYRLDIYKLLNRTSFWVVRVAIAIGLAQKFQIVLPPKVYSSLDATSQKNLQNLFNKKAWIHWCFVNCITLTKNSITMKAWEVVNSSKFFMFDHVWPEETLYTVYFIFFKQWVQRLEKMNNGHSTCCISKEQKRFFIRRFFIERIVNACWNTVNEVKDDEIIRYQYWVNSWSFMGPAM